MKPMKLLPLAGAVAVMASALTMPANAAPQSYPMVCRAGGNMYVQTALRTDDKLVLEVSFTRAPVSANTRMPAPGTCAWPDRPLRSSEPTKLRLEVANAGWMNVRCTQGFCEVQANSGDVMEMFGAVTGRLPFQVEVYNDRNGHMMITKVGP